jgi:ABC-2 type transport system permease protein/lipopolysaccharide transport system permease protein
MTVAGSRGTAFGDELMETNASTVPAEPPEHLNYKHRVVLRQALSDLWAAREIIYTLAERDFRAQYKQATLGILWAVISPLATLLLFVLVFSRVKTFGSQGLPYALYAFVGILCWNFFSTSFGNGGQSLLANKALLAKTQFPRECFPLETMCVQALNTLLSWIPLALLFVIFGRAPRLATLWVPMYMIIEVVFAAGIGLAISSTVIQMRDLVQVLPLVTTLGLFATPVIWPYSEIPTDFHVAGGRFVYKMLVNGHHIPAHWVGGFTINLQLVYGFLNPLGPVIAGARDTMLLGHAPNWDLTGVAALGAFCYLAVGYRIFKRLEEHFADIA